MTCIPASDPLLLALADAQARHTLFSLPHDPVQPLVVAVSGGADSVCLLHALLQMAGAWGLALHVAHVDHGLRPDSAQAAKFVAGLAATLRLPMHHTALDPAPLLKDPAGLEAAARLARYAFLRQVARQVTPAGSSPCVAVAHHANDQAETILLRLAQGSGLRGLSGMRPVSNAPGSAAEQPPVRLVRPLLAVSRAEVLAYLARHGLAWVEDASNDDLRFARNRLRQRVLPELAAINPAIVATLGRAAEVWAGDAARLAALDRAALDRLALEPLHATRIVLDLASWRSLPPAERRGVLRAAFDDLGADARQLGSAHLDAILAATDPQPRRTVAPGSGPHPLPGGLAWSVAGATPGRPAALALHALAEAPLGLAQPYLDAAWRAAQSALPLAIPGEVRAGGWRLSATLAHAADLPADWAATCGPWRLYACAAALAQPVLTTPRPGMRLQPLGMGGRHRRLVDLLRSHKIPATMRQGWPILVDCRDGRVLWVCGLQPAESLRISAQTGPVVLLEWSETTA